MILYIFPSIPNLAYHLIEREVLSYYQAYEQVSTFFHKPIYICPFL